MSISWPVPTCKGHGIACATPKAKQAARELGLARSYGSYEALLADPGIDAVYIPLPNHLHAEWVKKAADAGKHVLCEKPFALDAAQADEAVRYAESRGVKVMEAFMYRFHPQWVHAREVVRSGEIGKVQFIHTSSVHTEIRQHRNILSRRRLDYESLLCLLFGSSCGERAVRAVSSPPRSEFGTDVLSSGVLDLAMAGALNRLDESFRYRGWTCRTSQRHGIHSLM